MTYASDLIFFNDESINIFCCIIKGDKNYPHSCYIHTCNLFEGLDLISTLDNKTRVKRLLNIIRPKLQKDCHRSAILIDSQYKPYEGKFYQTYSSKILLDYVPTNPEELAIINQKIKNSFSSSDFDFYPQSSKFGSLNVKYESFPGGIWQNIFDNELISRPFYTTEDNIINVKYMARRFNTTNLKTFFSPKLNSLFINLPYTNDYAMLIIMPEEILTKDQLIQFCDNYLFASDIEYFYQIGGTMTEYDEVYIPKFNFNTEINLSLGGGEEEEDDEEELNYNDNSSQNGYIKMFYDSYPNYSRISRKLTNPNNGIYFSFYSHITCYEQGLKSSSSNDLKDDIAIKNFTKESNELRVLNIDRNFIFAFMDANHLINGFGFFINRDEDVDLI